MYFRTMSVSLALLLISGVSVALAGGPPAPLPPPSFCSDGNSIISVSDMTFRGANADNCYGLGSPNDNVTNIGFTGYQLLLKSDEGGTGSFMGVNFTLTGTPLGLESGKSGTWTLSWIDAPPVGDLPLTVSLVAVLAGGSRFAAYLFLDELLEVSPSSGQGDWVIKFTNPGGQIPDLSHLSLYIAQGTPTTRVPEPGSLALFSLALLGLGLTAYRRRRTL